MKETRALRAWGSLCGLLFAVLFVVGSALIFDGPNGDETQAQFADFYGDSGHRTRMNIGWILAGLGLFCFLWFVAALRETAREAEARESRRDGMLGFLVTIGGSTYAAVAMGAVGLAVGARTMSDDTNHDQVYGGVIHAFNDGTYVMHATGTAALAAMIFAFSLLILRTGVLPRWLGWFGVLAGVAALVSIMFVTMFIWLLWIAVASILLFMQARKPAAPATASGPA